MGKYSLTLCALLAMTAAAAPAFAQDAPAAAEKKAPAASSVGGMTKGGGAVSSSYARCTPEPGNPIGGVIVKGGQNPTKKTTASEPEGSCPPAGGPEGAEAAEGKGRTYTGGRRNDVQPSASTGTAEVRQGASLMGGRDGPLPAAMTAAEPGTPAGPGAEEAKIAPASSMPSRLSMTPTTTKQTAKVAPAPAQPAKGHSEKGIK